MNKNITLHIILFLFFGSSIASGEEHRWYIDIAADATHGIYEQSDLLDTGTTASIIMNLSYLERFGFTLKATEAIFKLKDNLPESRQNKFVLLAHNKIFSDLLKGSINSSLATFWISGSNVTKAFSISPEVNYLSNSQRFLLGAGYAYSSYGGNGSNKLKINQYTTSIGLTPYFNNFWLSAKSFHTEKSNQTGDAISFKLNWRPDKKTRALPISYLVGTLTGSRLYAVEQETLLIYNTEDKQKGGYFISATWNIIDNGYISLTFGSEKYSSSTDNKTYNYNYINANVSKTW